jgi:hypothetical protein
LVESGDVLENGVVPRTEKSEPCTHLHREKGATAVHLAGSK